VVDAVTRGWNEEWDCYLKAFEERFAEYLGVRYAMTTSSGTGALHLALAVLGIGQGDEVIVPDLTWVACANVVTYVKATPVFADVEEDSWCLDPVSVGRMITRRTKAIMPVHLYGRPANMDEINQIAQAHGLLVIEDAAPSLGAEYKGKKTGSLGNVAAFSFQGAKIAVTGEGGMLVTDDEGIYERAQFLGNQARKGKRPFWATEVGFKYKMSNLQAALGLAQLERIDDLLAKKRLLFHWYQERLRVLEDIRMNHEQEGIRSNLWMTSLVLPGHSKVNRDELIIGLKDRGIDSRPFFPPLSQLPMYHTGAVENPIAYRLADRGLSLPSGHNLTEDDVERVAQEIKRILGRELAPVATGSSIEKAYEREVLETLRRLKSVSPEGGPAVAIPVRDGDEVVGRLRPIPECPPGRINEDIKLLAKWRDAASAWFPSQFKVTEEGTRRWYSEQVIQAPDRILFMVETAQGVPVGHLGLFRFEFNDRTCEIDNVIRGRDDVWLGAMTLATLALRDWTFDTLAVRNLCLRVFSDNERGIALYERCGFKETWRIPLRRVVEGEERRWLETPYARPGETQRYFVTMCMANPRFP
jgi:perosamine synthetase